MSMTIDQIRNVEPKKGSMAAIRAEIEAVEKVRDAWAFAVEVKEGKVDEADMIPGLSAQDCRNAVAEYGAKLRDLERRYDDLSLANWTTLAEVKEGEVDGVDVMPEVSAQDCREIAAIVWRRATQR